jgi:hypothetical protein
MTQQRGFIIPLAIYMIVSRFKVDPFIFMRDDYQNNLQDFENHTKFSAAAFSEMFMLGNTIYYLQDYDFSTKAV